MRLAFYAPMKPPDHPQPSGDRRMANLLVAALRAAGHSVDLASRFRSYDGDGNGDRQRRLGAVGQRLAERLIRHYHDAGCERPRLWFTYHLYHKAPDWLGPAVSRALGIPYAVAEASHAPKQRDGPWATAYAAAADAIAGADVVFGINPADAPCVRALMRDPSRLVPLKPFLDTAPYASARRDRAGWARRHGLDPDRPWLLAVAMMRGGDKVASYRVLGPALQRILGHPWQLLVAGDGPAHGEVADALGGLGDRVAWLGRQQPDALPGLYASADLYVWPAVNEAYGMALLEAQAAGLPVVAGRSGGVAELIADGTTGRLVPAGNASALASAVAGLLEDLPGRRAMGNAARARAARDHDIGAASRTLDAALERLAA